MNTIFAIDPGPTQSAWLLLKDGQPISWRKEKNEAVITRLQAISQSPGEDRCDIAIEKVVSLGMPVGEEVFETVYWSGRFTQAGGVERVIRLSRMEVKMHLCNNSRAKDSNIRQALIDRFGGKASIRKGGMLHTISGDVWSALGVAVTLHDALLVRELWPAQQPTTEERP